MKTQKYLEQQNNVGKKKRIERFIPSNLRLIIKLQQSTQCGYLHKDTYVINETGRGSRNEPIYIYTYVVKLIFDKDTNCLGKTIFQ